MDKKLKMRKNMILYMFGMVAVLMGCFFYAPKEVKAAEPGTVQVSAQTVQFTADVPEEIKQPIEKGQALVTFLVRAAGWMVVVFGIVFLVMSFFSHQMDQRIMGGLALGLGLIVAFAPEIAHWITGA